MISSRFDQHAACVRPIRIPLSLLVLLLHIYIVVTFISNINSIVSIRIVIFIVSLVRIGTTKHPGSRRFVLTPFVRDQHAVQPGTRVMHHVPTHIYIYIKLFKDIRISNNCIPVSSAPTYHIDHLLPMTLRQPLFPTSLSV